MQVTCILTLEDVEEAFFDCNKQKRNKDAAVEYYKDYEANNFQLWLDLRNMTYRIGKSIAFCVIYPTLREVMAAEYRDRIVHHILALKFEPFFERMMIDTSFGCRKGKGTLLGVTTAYRQMQEVSNGFTEDAWVLKCDIKSYYMSIDRQILMDMVERVVVDDYGGEDADWWLWLWRKIIFHRPELDCEIHGDPRLFKMLEKGKSMFGTDGTKCLPIGHHTSRLLANVYLYSFDKYIMRLVLVGNGAYGRYMDDWYVICKRKEDALKCLEKAREYLRVNLRLELHPKKIYLQHVSKGFAFVGAVIKPHRIYVRKRTFQMALKKVKLHNKGQATDEELCMSLNSYFGLMRHYNTYALRWMLWKNIGNKERLCSVRMNKLIVINAKRHNDNNRQKEAAPAQRSDTRLHNRRHRQPQTNNTSTTKKQ